MHVPAKCSRKLPVCCGILVGRLTRGLTYGKEVALTLALLFNRFLFKVLNSFVVWLLNGASLGGPLGLCLPDGYGVTGLGFLDGMGTDGLCFLDRLYSFRIILMRAMPNSTTNFHQWGSMEDLITSRISQGLVSLFPEMSHIWGRVPLLGLRASTVGEEGAGISSREASSISASLGVLTWDDVSTGWGKSSGLVGKGVTRTMGSHLFGVELPDTSSDVSRTAQDRSSLTPMVMLTSP